MTALDALAVAALRRWRYERGALTRGRVCADDARPGRRPANQTEVSTNLWEGRIIRVLDFESAFATLDTEQQAVLLAVYGERMGDKVAAHLIGCSPRKVAYTKGPALTALAAALDRRNLL